MSTRLTNFSGIISWNNALYSLKPGIAVRIYKYPRENRMPPRKLRPAISRIAEPYQHTQETPTRPEVGTQAQFKKRKPPKTYRYGSSLDPALSWDDAATRTMGE